MYKFKQFLKIFMLLFIFSTAILNIFAQDTTGIKKKDKIKTGWNFGILPTVTYSTDLGLQYGGLINFFDFADGSTYPKPQQSVYLEVSRYTKGSGINRMYYDTKTLIPGIRTLIDLSYLTDKTYEFYGFNGYQSVYNSAWTDQDDPAYKTRMFYNYDRKIARGILDFQGNFKRNSKFNWVAGLSVYNFSTGSVDIDNLNKGKKDSDKLPDTATLYDKYVTWGIISDNEKNGGTIAYAKVGVVFDTRDHEASTEKGIWTEAILTMAPGFNGMTDYSHAILGLTHRQYIPIIEQRLNFVYRLSYQQLLGGDCPFFLAPNLTTIWLRRVSNEGLGGAMTLRGIKRNRVVGDGVAYGNIEMRWNAFKTVWFNQNWLFTLSAYADAGQVVDTRDIDFENVKQKAIADDPTFVFDDYFKDQNDKLHGSAGLGLHIVMNRNFVIGLEYGKAFNKQDGNSGFYMGMNYIF